MLPGDFLPGLADLCDDGPEARCLTLHPGRTSSSQPVAQCQPVGFVTSPLVSHAGPISGQHRAATPTEVPHRRHLGPPGGKPRVSRGVAELVGMDLVYARLGASALEHLGYAAFGHGSLGPKRQRRRARLGMARTKPCVLIEGLPGLGPEGDQTRPAPLAHHVDHVLVEVDVLHLSPATSPRPRPLLTKVRSMTTSRRSSNVGPSHAFSSFRSSLSETTGTGTSGTAGGFIRAIGSAGISPSPVSHLNSCWRLRYLTAAVVGFQRSRVSPINVSMWSRVMLATDVTPKLSRRKESSSRALSLSERMVLGLLFAARREGSPLGIRKMIVPYPTASASLM